MCVKSRGTIVNVAIWEKEVPFNPNWLTFRESNYQAVLGYNQDDFEAVLRNLASGQFGKRPVLYCHNRLTEIRCTQTATNDHEQNQDGEHSRTWVRAPD